MIVAIPVVNRLSKRIMRGRLFASQTPARADALSVSVCVRRCVAGRDPSGVLIPALVATLIRESGRDTSHLVTHSIQ